MTVVFTELARHDIDMAVRYISDELRNPQAVDNLLRKLFKRVRVLGQFPEVGTRITINNTPTQSRYLVVDNYLLAICDQNRQCVHYPCGIWAVRLSTITE